MLWKNLTLEGDIILSSAYFSAQKYREVSFYFGRKLDRAIIFSSEIKKAKLPKQLIA